jgi:hypothetical protein
LTLTRWRRAVANWKAHNDAPTARGFTEKQPARPVDLSAAPGSAPETGQVVRPWTDLATNRAAAEAREQALALKAQAPVKTFLARALDVHTDERAWRIGADGEEKVAAQLDKVAKKDPRWRSLHAIPVGNRGSDIDHLISGPGGVFTVNADIVTVKNAPDGVHVIPRMRVARWLLRHEPALSDATLDAVYDAARRSTTWRP